MAKVDRITDLIGNTPLVRINKLKPEGGAVIYAKLESFNPLNSAKDRAALEMIESAERDGALKKGAVIIESTSGNTGVALACVAAVKGYRLILTMPDSMSVERRKLLAALGAELVLTGGEKGMRGAIDKAEELAAALPLSFMPRQFSNRANPRAHEKTTGPEIWQDTEGGVDILVACAGTGGTVTGTAKFLKSKKPSIKVVAVEPEGSPVLSGGSPGPHKIQGIGAGFVPEIYDAGLVDEVFQCGDEEAASAARRLAREEGILTGISGGAAMRAAVVLSGRPENSRKLIVTILPDSGERYLSTWLWE